MRRDLAEYPITLEERILFKNVRIFKGATQFTHTRHDYKIEQDQSDDSISIYQKETDEDDYTYQFALMCKLPQRRRTIERFYYEEILPRWEYEDEIAYKNRNSSEYSDDTEDSENLFFYNENDPENIPKGWDFFDTSIETTKEA